jgi:uncharacterized protein (TIGR03437 family)
MKMFEAGFGPTVWRFRLGIAALILIFAGRPALAQTPIITAVVNAGSATTLLAPGTLATLYGSNLTSSASPCTTAGGVAWTTTLCGTQVTINGTPAPWDYVSASQASFQIPFGLNTGPASVIVVSQTGQSTSFTIQLSAFAPGIFTASGVSGLYHGSGTPVSAGSPAAIGEELILYSAGLGPTNPFVAADAVPTASPLDHTVTTPVILIDSAVQVAADSSVLAPDEVSLYQVNFTVPTLSPPGSHMLLIQSGGISSQTIPFPVAPLPFFQYEVSLGSGVYYQQFPDNSLFGYYNYVTNTIFYHYDMGYEAFIPGAAADLYLYDFTSGHWFYTSTTLFPYLYDFTLKSWIYYFPNTTNPGHYTNSPRVFANLSTNMIFSM